MDPDHDAVASAPANADPRINSVLQGRYRVTKLLGTGGMGRVYAGERVGLGRPVAIKFLHSMFAREPAAVKRFEREARAMSRLSHPNCISVIDVGVDGAPYIVMDYVTGRSLVEVLDDGLLRLRRVINITRQILAGLAHAHAQGIVHRDIKPGNIMLSEVEGAQDHVQILDFGLAKFRDVALTQDITASAMLVGTPGYMSPEQAEGEEAGAPSDIYAVGVLLFEMLTDRKPFEAEHPLEVLGMHRQAPIPSVRALVPDRKIPRPLERVVNKALAKDIDDRFKSASEFSRALDRIARQLDERRQRRRRNVAKASLAAAAVGLVSIAVFVVSSGSSSGHQTSVTSPALAANAAAHVEAAPAPTPKPKLAPTPVPLPESEKPPLAQLPVEPPVAPAPPSKQEIAALRTPASDGPPPSDVKGPLRLRDIRQLIARKQNAAAIRGLLKLRRQHPTNSYMAYLIATLCMEQEMWHAAVTHYRIAIGIKNAYRKNPKVIRDGVFVLSSLRAKDRLAAHNLLVHAIGAPALARLDRTARYSKSPRLRRSAASAATQIRGKYRRTSKRRSRRR